MISHAGVASGTSDFWIRFDRVNRTGFDFVYASSSVAGIWSSQNFTNFSLTEAPEPGSFALVALGLAAFRGARRRHRP